MNLQTLLVLTATAAPVLAQTTVTVPSARDNTLYESSAGALSGGAGTGLFVGVTDQSNDALRRALVYFDVASAVPTGAHVVSATLSIQVSQHNMLVDVNAHRVLQDWGEGTSVPFGGGGAGAPATTNDATWIHSFYPSSNWTTPGGDFAATSSLTIAVPSSGAYTSVSTVAALDDVQSWLDSPTQNFGWLLKTNELVPQSALRCNSREAANNPPRLHVTYLTNGQATTWGQGCLVGGQPFQHAWNGAPIGGTSPQLTQTNGPANALAANLLSLNYDRTGFPLLPSCNLYLPFPGLIVTHSIFNLDANGNGSTPIVLPPGFPGVMFTSQTAALSTTPSGFVLSNAAIAVLQ